MRSFDNYARQSSKKDYHANMEHLTNVPESADMWKRDNLEGYLSRKVTGVLNHQQRQFFFRTLQNRIPVSSTHTLGYERRSVRMQIMDRVVTAAKAGEMTIEELDGMIAA